MSTAFHTNVALVNDFFNQIKDTNIKIYKFTMDSQELRALFDYDPTDYSNTCMISTLSEYIEKFLEIPTAKKEEFLLCRDYNWYESEDPDLYSCYQMYKILWLCEDIKINGQQAPVQFIKTSGTYLCHPGSDKRYAITLLEPLSEIRCFYIYYPEIDNDFDIPAELELINDVGTFVDLFPMVHHNTFEFEIGNALLTPEKYECADHFEPFAREGCNAINSYRDSKDWEIQVPHLSYRDSIHRENMLNNLEGFTRIELGDDGLFYLGPYKFQKINNIWTPMCFLNYPASIIDNKFNYQEKNVMRIKK